MKFQKRINLTLIFTMFLNYNTYSQLVQRDSLELFFGFKYGYEYNHVIINVGKNIQKNKLMIGMGAFYRSLNYPILTSIYLEKVLTRVKFYGVNFSISPGKIMQKHIAIRFKDNLVTGVAIAKYYYRSKNITMKPVYLFTNYLGPELSLKISNRIKLRGFWGIGIGYGTTVNDVNNVLAFGEGEILDGFTQTLSINIKY